MMQKMGYTVGAALGMSGDGLIVPINALDRQARRNPYDREGLSSGAGASSSASAAAGAFDRAFATSHARAGDGGPSDLGSDAESIADSKLVGSTSRDGAPRF